MIKQVGKYNVDYNGYAYDNDGRYHFIVISEWDNKNKKEIDRKTFYLTEHISLDTEEEISKIMEFPSNSTLEIKRTISITRKK